MSYSDNRLYRARDGMLLGVCLGISRSRNIPVAVLRLAVILLVMSTGFLGAGLYILAGVLMEPEPAVKPESRREADFYDRFRSSRVSALGELKDRISRLDARLRGMEDKVTRKGFDWDERLRRGQ